MKRNAASLMRLLSMSLIVCVLSCEVAAQEPLTKFLDRQKLAEQIDHWRTFQENSFKILYSKELEIEIKQDTAAFVIDRYAEAKLAPIFSKDAEEIGRAHV